MKTTKKAAKKTETTAKTTPETVHVKLELLLQDPNDGLGDDDPTQPYVREEDEAPTVPRIRIAEPGEEMDAFGGVFDGLREKSGG